MNLKSKIEKLEKKRKQDEIPSEIWCKYRILTLCYNPQVQTMEQAKDMRLEKAVKSLVVELNVSLEKARVLIDKINPFFICAASLQDEELNVI